MFHIVILISAYIKYFALMNKGDKFLKKLCCCVGGKVEQGHLVLSTELTT